MWIGLIEAVVVAAAAVMLVAATPLARAQDPALHARPTGVVKQDFGGGKPFPTQTTPPQPIPTTPPSSQPHSGQRS